MIHLIQSKHQVYAKLHLYMAVVENFTKRQLLKPQRH